MGEDLVHLHPPVLGHGQQHVEHLGRLDVLGRVQQQRVDRQATRLQIALELCSSRADLVGPRERVHALVERSLGAAAGSRRWFRSPSRSPSPWAASLHTDGSRSRKNALIQLYLNLSFSHVEACGWSRRRFAGFLSSLIPLACKPSPGRRQARAGLAEPVVRRLSSGGGRHPARARSSPRRGVAEALGADRHESGADVEQIARVRGAAHPAHADHRNPHALGHGRDLGERDRADRGPRQAAGAPAQPRLGERAADRLREVRV